MPDLKGIDPDDAFSSVPYEKGFALLYYLEQLVGGPGQYFSLYIIRCSFCSGPSPGGITSEWTGICRRQTHPLIVDTDRAHTPNTVCE